MMEIRKVGILGAGTMGRGIAAAIVQKGVEVLLCEKDQELRTNGAGKNRRGLRSRDLALGDHRRRTSVQ